MPNLENFSWMTVVSAMGQMFYSLSIAMGILVTFGSYMKKDTSIEDSTRNVEIFDTAIAIMAGLMIIPAVFAFSGGDPEHLAGGPVIDVHHDSEGVRQHGPRHGGWHSVLRARAVCGGHKLYCADGKRRFHVSKMNSIGTAKSRPLSSASSCSHSARCLRSATARLMP